MFSQLQRELEAQELKKAKEQKIITDETGRINSTWLLHFYRWGFAYTLGSNLVYNPWQFHTNLYGIYIYSVIRGNQFLLEKILNKYLTDNRIKELKKSTILSEVEFDKIVNDIKYTKLRFDIYEGIFKQIFEIPITELNLKNIVKKIPTFEFLAPQQIEALQNKLIAPIFGVEKVTDIKTKQIEILGYFQNIYKPPLFFINCKINLTDGTRSNCKIFSSPFFPFPSNIYTKKYGYAIPDCIYPITLWNELSSDIKTSIDIAKTIPWWTKLFYDGSYGEFLGLGEYAEQWFNWGKEKKEWVSETYEDTKQVAENIAKVAADTAKQAADIAKSISNFIQNPPKPSDIINKIAITGGIVLAGYILMNEITS